MNDRFIGKKRSQQAAITGLIYLSLIILSIYLVWDKKLVNLQPSYIINVGVDIFGMLIGYVLFISTLIDVQKTGVNHRYHFYLINVTFMGLFCDLVSWLVDGVPELRVINIIDNTVYYMCMPLVAYFFWLYVKTVMGIDNKLEKIVSKIMLYTLIAALLTRIVNLFTGMYFTVDAAGVYSRSAGYPFSLIYAYMTSIATLALIIKNRHKLEKYKVVALILYILAPTLSTIFTMKVYGLSISFAVIMLILLLMYCVISIAQGRDKAIADRDLAMATAIQENSIPHIFPAFPERKEFDLFASMDTAKEVGGDFYDYFLIDDDHLAMVMADVSGKGVPAALFMMASKIMIGNVAKMGAESPARILEVVNDQICENNTEEMFVTVWLGILEISTGKLTAANAGHEYPAIRHKNGEFELYKDKHGFVVGGMAGMKYKDYEIMLEPGDAVFQYTDGVTEATNAAEELFGADRLIGALNMEEGANPERIVKNVSTAIDEFVGEAPQFDDVTMICLEYKGE